MSTYATTHELRREVAELKREIVKLKSELKTEIAATVRSALRTEKTLSEPIHKSIAGTALCGIGLGFVIAISIVGGLGAVIVGANTILRFLGV